MGMDNFTGSNIHSDLSITFVTFLVCILAQATLNRNGVCAYNFGASNTLQHLAELLALNSPDPLMVDLGGATLSGPLAHGATKV